MQNVKILTVSPRPQMRDVRAETLLHSLRDAHYAVEQVATAALYTIRSPRSAAELETCPAGAFHGRRGRGVALEPATSAAVPVDRAGRHAARRDR